MMGEVENYLALMGILRIENPLILHPNEQKCMKLHCVICWDKTTSWRGKTPLVVNFDWGLFEFRHSTPLQPT